MLGGAAGSDDDDGAPWHDQTMPIADRMKLAEGRPLRRRMMAAMAQQDCGQCGYDCHDYSDAIASKAEPRLNLCVPGGKETARMLKVLHEELDKAPTATQPAASASAVAAPVVEVPLGRSRDNPAPATFLSRRLLNKPGSERRPGTRIRPQRLRPGLWLVIHLGISPATTLPRRPDHRLARGLAHHGSQRPGPA